MPPHDCETWLCRRRRRRPRLNRPHARFLGAVLGHMLVTAYPARPILDCKARLGACRCEVFAAAVGALHWVLDILLAATFAAALAAAAALAVALAETSAQCKDLCIVVAGRRVRLLLPFRLILQGGD
jgi:hypothetical protein